MKPRDRTENIPEWEKVLSAASHLQTLLPGAVLVGGTSAALIADHRFSRDADHVVVDLRSRFDAVLKDLESISGWKTSRVNRPVLILGSLDGIETGIRQLIRSEPLETTQVPLGDDGDTITIPTQGECLRIKGILILKRNATRDYLDFAALSEHMGADETYKALQPFDKLYPQQNGKSPWLQLQAQLSLFQPYDLSDVDLKSYKGLRKDWQDVTRIKQVCQDIASAMLNFSLVDPLQKANFNENDTLPNEAAEPDRGTFEQAFHHAFIRRLNDLQLCGTAAYEQARNEGLTATVRALVKDANANDFALVTVPDAAFPGPFAVPISDADRDRLIVGSAATFQVVEGAKYCKVITAPSLAQSVKPDSQPLDKRLCECGSAKSHSDANPH